MKKLTNSAGYLKELTRKVATFINATIHCNEPVDSGLVFDWRIMQACVEHDDSKWQHITRIWNNELTLHSYHSAVLTATVIIIIMQSKPTE